MSLNTLMFGGLAARRKNMARSLGLASSAPDPDEDTVEDGEQEQPAEEPQEQPAEQPAPQEESEEDSQEDSQEEPQQEPEPAPVNEKAIRQQERERMASVLLSGKPGALTPGMVRLIAKTDMSAADLLEMAADFDSGPKLGSGKRLSSTPNPVTERAGASSIEPDGFDAKGVWAKAHQKVNRPGK